MLLQNRTIVTAPVQTPFSLAKPAAGRLGRLYRRAAGSLERLLAIDQVNALYALARGDGDWTDFLRRVLDRLNVSYRLPRIDLQRIPATGPVIVVANHPFGALDGIVLAAVLSSVRPDVKIMANHILGRIPELRNLFVLVDPFGGDAAARDNVRSIRQSIHLLEGGGMLGVFPAGEVSHANLRRWTVTDPPWSSTVARLVRKTKATVLPVYFDGQNSLLFQIMGLVHPRLRTAMLARELFRQQHRRIDLRIGSPVPFSRLDSFDDDTQLTAYLRHRTYALRHRVEPAPRPAGSSANLVPVVAATPADAMEKEVTALPPQQMLVEGGELSVFCAAGEQIPHTLREIGRLREITFRATGEGTGKPIDLDRFDQTYLHLFVWNKTQREIVGAYRFGKTDELVRNQGIEGLYTSTLFHYRQSLLDRIGPGLELGRSFVRGEYQKSYAALLLLWKGVGQYVVQNPKYKCLLGPVSISSNYQSVSRQLMVQFLRAHHQPPELGELVRPRNPFRPKPLGEWETDLAGHLHPDGEEVAALVADIEPDQKGLPVLLRQYLKLGAKLLDFNIDPDFSDVLDGLMLVDLTKTDARMLERYMGKDGRQHFMACHRR